MWVRPPDRPGPRKRWPDLAIRDGEWKLLVFRDGSKPRLFNVVEDPSESKNRAKDHPQKVARLSQLVIEWDRSIREQATASHGAVPREQLNTRGGEASSTEPQAP
jgi:hypothetical protein